MVSLLSYFDIQCVATGILFFVSNTLAMIATLRFRNESHFNYYDMMQLNPDAIKEQWDFRNRQARFDLFNGMVNSLTWFMLICPVVKVAWIQHSWQGKGKLGLHIMVVSCILIGSFTEVVSQLLLIGTQTGTAWISNDFVLSNWTGTNDEVGWKTLEVASNIANAMMLWIDSAEWFFLSGLFVLLYISVRDSTNNSRKQREKQFSMRWARFGIFIGILCLFNFISDLLRFHSFRFFSSLAFFISIINRLVLIPSWLFWLALQLPAVEECYDYGCIDGDASESYNAPKSNRIDDNDEDEVRFS